MAFIVWLIFNIVLIVLTNAYNIDLRSASVFHDPLFSYTESYFGFTVALQMNPKRLLVGAPKSNSSQTNYRNMHEPGLVYDCKVGSNPSCNPIILEYEGNSFNQYYRDRKDEGWLGGTIETQHNSSTMVTCGSRWSNNIHADYYLMNGACYVTNQYSRDSTKLLPLLNENNQKYEAGDKFYFHYSYGQAGFSAHLTPAMDLIVGAPGVMEWTGTVLKYSKVSSNANSDALVPNPYFTKGLHRNSYLGYAVSSGMFTKEERLFVASAPRGASYFGQVIIFQFPDSNEKPLDIHFQLDGFQMGEYFGASLAVVDVNADGLDDLLVGAPMYSTSKAGDSGTVYVFLCTQLSNGQSPQRLTGLLLADARFGTSIGALGDLDQDGFNDVAIGAPYEKHGSSQGAVYIYRGGKSGLSDTPSQRILSSDILIGIRGFGISISTAVDIDNNFYPDIAVGAHYSGHALVLKTNPIVRVKSRLTRSVKNVSYNTTRLIFEACVEYNGNHLNPNIDFNVTIVVDKFHSRATFLSGGNIAKFVVNLRAGVETCKALIVNLTSPSSWTGSAAYAAIPLSMTTTLSSSNNCVVCPILDPNSNSTVLEKIQVMNTCDKDECIPVWRLSASFPNVSSPFVIGSANSIPFFMTITNDGDSARVMQINIQLPESVKLRLIPSNCEKAANHQLNCFNSLLISSGQQNSIFLNLDVSDFDEALLLINVTALSYDLDTVYIINASLHAVKLLRIRAEGRAFPEIAVLLRGAPSKPELFSLSHSYHVFCAGYTPVQRIRLSLNVPVKVRIERTWYSFLNFTYTGLHGESKIRCSTNQWSDRVRRDTIFGKDRALSCGKTTEEVECRTVICEAGPLLPKSSGLTLTLKMDVSMSVSGLLLSKAYEVYLNTSATSEIVGFPDSIIIHGVSTILAGPVPQKDDPLYPLYIAVGIIIALIILALIFYILYKVGFFKRVRNDEVIKEKETAFDSGQESDEDLDSGERTYHLPDLVEEGPRHTLSSSLEDADEKLNNPRAKRFAGFDIIWNDHQDSENEAYKDDSETMHSVQENKEDSLIKYFPGTTNEEDETSEVILQENANINVEEKEIDETTNDISKTIDMETPSFVLKGVDSLEVMMRELKYFSEALEKVATEDSKSDEIDSNDSEIPKFENPTTEAVVPLEDKLAQESDTFLADFFTKALLMSNILKNDASEEMKIENNDSESFEELQRWADDEMISGFYRELAEMYKSPKQIQGTDVFGSDTKKTINANMALSEDSLKQYDSYWDLMSAYQKTHPFAAQPQVQFSPYSYYVPTTQTPVAAQPQVQPSPYFYYHPMPQTPSDVTIFAGNVKIQVSVAGSTRPTIPSYSLSNLIMPR